LIVRTIGPGFLSFTIDTSLIIGGRWWGQSRGLEEGLSKDRVEPLDLADPILALRTAALAPALLRVGGTEADRLHYGFDKGAPHSPGDGPFVLRKKLWKDLCSFAHGNGLELLFTLAAGPETRNAWGDWDPRDAIRLMDYTRRKGLPVVAWELGNEVNAYPFLYGWRRGVSSRRYAREFARFAALVREHHPGALAVGPSSAFWPLVGEPHPLLPALCRSPAAAELGALSFHYYPQQSSRGRIAVRRAKEGTMLNARALDGAARWVRNVLKSRNAGPGRSAPLWVTETGHALYGGQPGLSDSWLSTPWWLDQLALMAYEGVDRVFRQSLVGGAYGLLDEATLEPRPDYHASFLWKKLIGASVFDRPDVRGPDRSLRAWCHGGKEGGRCLLLINLNRQSSVSVTLDQPSGRRLILEPEGGALSPRMKLNGVLVDRHLEEHWGTEAAERLYSLSSPPREAEARRLVLPPLACAFVEIP
jgi:heparanase 1